MFACVETSNKSHLLICNLRVKGTLLYNLEHSKLILYYASFCSDELRSSKMGLNIDLIVRVIRSTRNRRTLQESLRLLTVATKLAQVYGHLVLAFLGSDMV